MKSSIITYSVYLYLLLAIATGFSFQADTVDAPPTAKAVFAGGCFWCMEPPFDALEGVISTVSGYTGGHLDNPTYTQVSKENTGHYEAIEITYDPSKIDYATLLSVFWHNIDPTDDLGQFCDKGDSYRSAIFYLDMKQKNLAERSKQELMNSAYLAQPVATKVLEAKKFYPAEDYHQNYYQKNPLRYKYYRYTCGRDHRLDSIWGASARKGGPVVPEMMMTSENK